MGHSIIAMPPKAQASLQKSRQKDRKGQRQMTTGKQCFLDTTEQLYTQTHCEFDSTHKICPQARQNPRMEKRDRYDACS